MKNEFETTEPNVTEENNPTATSHSNTLTIGMVLDGKYEIRREIARGGMGIVYEAYHNFFNKKVAIKIILSDKINSLQLKRFQKEIEACAKLSHPNIIHIYNAGIYNNTPYIVMDYIDGVDICQYVEQHDENYGKIKLHIAGLGIKRDWKLCVQLIYKTALALEYIHSKKMLHRDIKPSNILVQPDGTPIIIDLGLVKFKSKKFDSLTESGDLLGTLQYMSIEQSKGKHGRIDARSDIYSLGLVLYELLTERMAYSGENLLEISYKIMSYYPPLPRKINPKIPEALEEITIHATEKKKEKRYTTAQEFADALKKYLDDENTQATKKYNYYKKCVQLQQNKKRIVACFIALVVLIIATIAIINSNFILKLHEKIKLEKIEELFRQALQYQYKQNYKEAVKYFEKAANNGHTISQNNLAVRYLKGEGVQQNFQKAIFWFEKAANNGHTMSQYNLGVIYIKGQGVKQDSQKAIFWFEKAANNGYEKAQYDLAYLYYCGLGIEQNYQKAFTWYEKLANNNHGKAQLYLGCMYYYGLGTKQNYKEAYYWFEKVANQGYGKAQLYLSCMYYYGLGIEQNYQKAIDYLKQTMEKKLVHSQYIFKIISLPQNQNSKTLSSSFERIVKKGNAYSQLVLGIRYFYGLGIEPDLKKAKDLFEIVTNKKNKDTQLISTFTLGYMYYNGLGIKTNLKKAKDLFEKIANQEYIEAQALLGEMYAQGKGVKQDYSKALYWYEKAANQGHADSQVQLFIMYAQGKGVKQDNSKALYWIEKSINQGNPKIKEKIILQNQ